MYNQMMRNSMNEINLLTLFKDLHHEICLIIFIDSDAELKLKLVSNTGMETVSPHVTFQVAAPPTTAAIMSRTSGPRDQTITFSPDNKTITWTISQFPGGSYAQAFIRVSNNLGCTYSSITFPLSVFKYIYSYA